MYKLNTTNLSGNSKCENVTSTNICTLFVKGDEFMKAGASMKSFTEDPVENCAHESMSDLLNAGPEKLTRAGHIQHPDALRREPRHHTFNLCLVQSRCCA